MEKIQPSKLENLRKKMMNSRFIFIGMFILSTCTTDKEQRAVSYYKSGRLKHEVLLINGKPEGLALMYFESGKILSKTHWKNGKKHGASVFYYENGNVEQESVFKEDLYQITKAYTEDGFLKQIRVYDSLGRLFDFYKYKKDGSRDFGPRTKDLIFIPERDTVSHGEEFTTEIRLGNRQFDNIEVIIGDIEDSTMIKDNPPLPKKDSLTSMLRIKAEASGVMKITGIVIERSATSDSLDAIPFTYPLFVRKN
jgi:antitoxin component YwqK of YwqJK toxin-antitoxin module